jgi:hypothetical protein
MVNARAHTARTELLFWNSIYVAASPYRANDNFHVRKLGAYITGNHEGMRTMGHAGRDQYSKLLSVHD